MSELQSVVINQKEDGSWQAVHVPSGKTSEGSSKEEVEDEMRKLLGMDDGGDFNEPLTSQEFNGKAKEIAEFLEGPVSEMLAMHSGFARLDQYKESIAYVRLGGGCQGCPSSTMTLVAGVQQQLQETFGSDVVQEVIPSF